MKTQFKVAVISRKLKRKTLNAIEGITFSFPKSFELAMESAPDIVIIDDTQECIDTEDNIKILIVGEPTKEKIINFCNYNGFAGFLQPETSPHLIAKAIECVQNGETWLSRKTMSLIFEDYLKNMKKMSQIWLECLLNFLRTRKENTRLSELFNMTRTSKALSKREKEILELVAGGDTNKDIANALFISEKTVRTHLYNIFRKLDITKRAEAVSLIMDVCSTESVADILLSFTPFVHISKNKK